MCIRDRRERERERIIIRIAIWWLVNRLKTERLNFFMIYDLYSYVSISTRQTDVKYINLHTTQQTLSGEFIFLRQGVVSVVGARRFGWTLWHAGSSNQDPVRPTELPRCSPRHLELAAYTPALNLRQSWTVQTHLFKHAYTPYSENFCLRAYTTLTLTLKSMATCSFLLPSRLGHSLIRN